MKLIIERSGGKAFAYMESEARFRSLQGTRHRLVRLDPSVLNDECSLAHYGSGWYMVFDIVDPETPRDSIFKRFRRRLHA